MRTTVTLDDILLDQAREFSGIKETSALMREALKRLVQSEAARRLAAMGGSAPDMIWNVPGRRQISSEE